MNKIIYNFSLPQLNVNIPYRLARKVISHNNAPALQKCHKINPVAATVLLKTGSGSQPFPVVGVN